MISSIIQALILYYNSPQYELEIKETTKTGCSPEDFPEAMNDREKWREKVKDIRASGMT